MQKLMLKEKEICCSCCNQAFYYLFCVLVQAARQDNLKNYFCLLGMRYKWKTNIKVCSTSVLYFMELLLAVKIVCFLCTL